MIDGWKIEFLAFKFWLLGSCVIFYLKDNRTTNHCKGRWDLQYGLLLAVLMYLVQLVHLVSVKGLPDSMPV